MSKRGLPGLSHVDHVAITVPDLDKAVTFYSEVIGGTELYRIGPFDAATMPQMPDGRDWTQAHVNVPGAVLTIAMLQVGPNLMLELSSMTNQPIGGRSRREFATTAAITSHSRWMILTRPSRTLNDHGLRVMAGPIVLNEGPCAGLRVNYFLDPWGNQLEIVEYKKQAFEEKSPVPLYRPVKS